MIFKKIFLPHIFKYAKSTIIFNFGLRHVSTQPQVCIIGSGPAGFVLAQTLLKNNAQIKIDMFENRPVPFGLIRYGVSPDHQDVKNCINGYTKTAQSDRFTFFGNINVGKDLTLQELCNAYHAVVLCTGAQGERRLGIPGENLQNVFSSNQFVGWYNGVPEYQNLDIDLSGKTAVIVGVGNVALDVARILLKPVKQLQDSDMTEQALKKLSSSSISNVHIIGRRGPLQMACTRKELSEITDMCDVATYIETEHFTEAVQTALDIKDLKLRKHQRLIKYLQKKAASNANHTALKKFFVKFLRSPLYLTSQNGKSVSAISFQKRKMTGNDAFNPKIFNTCTTEEFNCDLVVSCIGYNNTAFDSDMVPYKNEKIIQKNGQINLENGLYTCGWCSHGPKGVLADSGNDSLLTGSSILSDLSYLLSNKSECSGSYSILEILKQRNIKYIKWNGWEKIDQFEIINGKKHGKIREKVLSYEEMLSIATN